MSLINQTNEEYYAGEKMFAVTAAPQTVFECTFEPDLHLSSSTEPTNFKVQVSTDSGTTFSDYSGAIVSVSNNNIDKPPFNKQTITLNPAVPNTPSTLVRVVLKATTLWNNYGSYQYIKLNDIVNNFLIAYVGDGKLIPSVKRTDVIFHAKRGLQEFSYDTLKSIKSVELSIPSSLSLIIPQDYVNIVRLSWIDELGVQRIIYPANNLTTAPYSALSQDQSGFPIQDANSNNVEVPPSTIERWNNADTRKITGNYNWNAAYNTDAWLDGYPMLWQQAVGERYGLNPSTTQVNGWYLVDERRGTFNFSSNLAKRLIVLEYISDGLATDLETKVPKLAEDAMYAHINHSILASRINQPEYIVQRYKKERSAKLRNAKIRLSNIKLDQIVQVMRGKSKWIKN